MYCFRTFSKAYGMAGMRWIRRRPRRSHHCLHKIRNHWRHRIARPQARTADQPLRRRSEVAGARNIAAIAPTASACRQPPISSPSIAAVMASTPEDSRYAGGQRRLRPHAGRGPFNRCIRITAGTAKDLAIFAEELPKAHGRQTKMPGTRPA
jgi:histidinol-phosphate aminotransferase